MTNPRQPCPECGKDRELLKKAFAALNVLQHMSHSQSDKILVDLIEARLRQDSEGKE